MSPASIAASIVEAALLAGGAVWAWRAAWRLPKDTWLRDWSLGAIIVTGAVFVVLTLAGAGPVLSPLFAAIGGPMAAWRWARPSYYSRPSREELAYRAERERLRAFFRTSSPT